VAVEWADTALVPFPSSGALFTGTMTQLASAVARCGDKFPLYAQSEAVLRVRFRHLHFWVRDLQEHIAARSLTR